MGIMIITIKFIFHKSFKMKKLLQSLMLIAVSVVLSTNANGQAVADSIEMGDGYANDVYYSFENGEVLSTPRVSWDIAFHTPIFSATILTNDGGGVELYTYPDADTSGWNNLDTNGMAGWKIIYNSDTVWEDGAFNRNTTGHPDYGWGRYNPINHDVVGDSIYVLKGIDGQYRKVWIERKNSIGNTYYLRYANLDGTNEQKDTLNINPYTSKNFVYYTFSDGELIDREPDTASWDILFTQYQAVYPTGDIVKVTGVLNNMKVYSNRFHPVGLDYIDWLAEPLDTARAPIGWDWKTFNFQTFTYDAVDSLVYFVQTWDRSVYKLYFTAFYSGMAGGKAVFMKELISPASIEEILPAEGIMTISPNPARDHFRIQFEEDIDERVSYLLVDLSGRQLLNGETYVSGRQLELSLPEGPVTSGMHILFVQIGNKAFTSKLIVNNN
jgi:hypothetical protein